MNIVAAPPHYPPRSRVGSWLATHELLARLAVHHDVQVFPRCSAVHPYIFDGVRVEQGKKIPVLERAIETADVVISHLGDDGICARLAMKHGRPNVRMIHSQPADAHLKLVGCDLAVFNSESLAKQIGWPGPQIVVHPPVRPMNALPGTKITLVNLSQAKGGELFWRLAHKLPDLQFLAVRGWGMQLIHRSPNVHVIANQRNMERVFNRTRILLMPSESETWGMTGVEAMSCGIPVIAHPTEGLQESLGDAGIFADRDREAQWLTAIERLQDYHQWEEASHQARLRAAELAADDGHARFADAIESLVPVLA